MTKFIHLILVALIAMFAVNLAPAALTYDQPSGVIVGTTDASALSIGGANAKLTRVKRVRIVTTMGNATWTIRAGTTSQSGNVLFHADSAGSNGTTNTLAVDCDFDLVRPGVVLNTDCGATSGTIWLYTERSPGVY